ncbi:MAG: hypothetical protein PHU44_14735 [Syntrophales bacterium]|nr:hypothetical protein [Syntrophales bacterium]MDD5642758.1 hypothetical protein [Syntrophales bacterium]
MKAGWQIVAFPVILPWREEFWTLPLYFPDLKIGVAPDWPSNLPYQGLPLPPEAQAPGRELKGLHPGDLKQWQAFKEYQQTQNESEDDLIKAIRQYEAAATPKPESHLDPWHLAWQLEKMQADQEARLVRVDQGQEWLAEILAPEPWEERQSLGQVPGIDEMVDPELAKLRYLLWKRVMEPHLQDLWTPLLLGRTARSIFLTLRGWPQWTGLRSLPVSLPGCRGEAEWAAIMGDASLGKHLAEFRELLSSTLTRAAADDAALTASRELPDFVEKYLVPHWPLDPLWHWTLEIWGPDREAEEAEPVLCWTGAGAGVLPG